MHRLNLEVVCQAAHLTDALVVGKKALQFTLPPFIAEQ